MNVPVEPARKKSSSRSIAVRDKGPKCYVEVSYDESVEAFILKDKIEPSVFYRTREAAGNHCCYVFHMCRVTDQT